MDKKEKKILLKEFIKYTKDEPDVKWMLSLTFLLPLLLLFIK